MSYLYERKNTGDKGEVTRVCQENRPLDTQSQRKRFWRKTNNDIIPQITNESIERLSLP